MSIFDASDFVTRNHCGQWSDGWMAAYIIGNTLIGLSYFAIPVVLLGTLKRNWTHKPNRTLIILFSLFIFLCGGGHLVDGVGAFVWPNYRFFAAWHSATGAVSLATAIVLPRTLAGYLGES